MLAIPILLVLAGVSAWGLYDVRPAIWVFYSLLAVLVFWLFVASRSLRPKLLREGESPYFFTRSEIAVFRKHALYFRHPYTARQYSSAFSGVQVFVVLWVALLLYRREWVLAAITAPVYMVGANMSAFLNPGNLLRYHAGRGSLPPSEQERLAVIESVENKLTANLQARSET